MSEPAQKSNEWYTPFPIIEAARKVMGSIDLDPASSHEANAVVQATHYYTQKENGLAYDWSGNVWLNPPYGRENGSGKSVIRMFVTRLVEEYEAGNIKQAILLTTVQTNSTWFQLLWKYLICFTSSRVAFHKPNRGLLIADSRTSHPLGTAFIYLGPNEARFIEVFSRFGRIVRAIDTPPAKPTNLELWSA